MKVLPWSLVLFLCAAAPAPVATILLSPATLTIDAPVGGPAPSPSTLTVQNTGDARLNWKATPSAPWLHVSPGNGKLNSSASIALSVTVNLNNLTPGTYTGSITVSDPAASNNPQVCSVTLHVNGGPSIGLTPPGPLSWTAPENGPKPADQTLTIQNTGGGTLTWTATDNASWLTTSPGSGTLTAGASDTVTFSVDTTGLIAGPYSGSWTVTSNASNSPQTVAVSLTVTQSPVIGISPSTLTFDAPQAGANPSPATLTLTNVGGGTLSWTATPDASWLAVSPTFGNLGAGANQPLTVSVTTGTLAEGTYLAAVHLAAMGATNTPQLVNVTFNVNAQPKIGTNPKALSFAAASDQGNSSPSALSVTNTGSGTLVWSASPSASWLSVSPSGGSLGALGSQPVLLSVHAAGMTPGHYTATVDVSDPNALNTPQTVSIDLTVTESSLPVHAPAGQCGLLGPELAIVALLLRRKRGVSSC